ncbi:TMEM175 family protein [Xanthobacter autotrophicus DSM 431]|uniref:TMEM175 family protein n=1 Tax=Xanthobacter nonsaccharivorans TaxID=3119912 RepID=UPI00372CDEEC
MDALSDGVFAFAMTLLVLDIRLPDDLDISSAAGLWSHLLSLRHQTLTYVISFFVLGALWRGGIELRPTGDAVGGGVVRLVLLFLFFVTMVPFSSGLVGRYGNFAPAVLVYAANMATLGALTITMRYLDVMPGHRSFAAAAGPKLPLFIATAALAALIALVEPRYAMSAFFLNALSRLPGWPRGGFGGAGGSPPEDGARATKQP